MAPKLNVLSWLLLVLIIIFWSGAKTSESAKVFTIINNCDETIWPAINSGKNYDGGGYMLKSRQSVVVTIPVGWSGRIWGRTGCSFNSEGVGKCETGACGETLKCTASGKTPATLAEFTLEEKDFYDVSLVDGFNLPMLLTPLNGGGNCTVAGCTGDLRTTCPTELSVRVGSATVGCRSACDVFDTDEYCCRGVYGNSAVCRATYYSSQFKAACPRAYTYAYDDSSSLYTCITNDYVISFCPGRKPQPCTFHNNKRVCSGSTGFKLLIGNWWTLILPFFSIINIWIFS